MTDDSNEVKIEQALRAKPWYGLISVEEAITDALAYRSNLNREDRQIYDAQIELGRHPVSALETVEILSGRQQPQGNERLSEMAALMDNSVKHCTNPLEIVLFQQ